MTPALAYVLLVLLTVAGVVVVSLLVALLRDIWSDQ